MSLADSEGNDEINFIQKSGDGKAKGPGTCLGRVKPAEGLFVQGNDFGACGDGGLLDACLPQDVAGLVKESQGGGISDDDAARALPVEEPDELADEKRVARAGWGVGSIRIWLDEDRRTFLEEGKDVKGVEEGKGFESIFLLNEIDEGRHVEKRGTVFNCL